MKFNCLLNCCLLFRSCFFQEIFVKAQSVIFALLNLPVEPGLLQALHEDVVVSIYDIRRNVLFFKDNEVRITVEVDAQGVVAEKITQFKYTARVTNVQIIHHVRLSKGKHSNRAFVLRHHTALHTQWWCQNHGATRFRKNVRPRCG